MQSEIDRLHIEDQDFRWWLTCAAGLSIAQGDQFDEWCDKEGYKELEEGSMAMERWDKHWIRQSMLVTGALPSEF